MASATGELGTLRALTFRISSTPTSQLPQHVPAIAASLANCKALLSSTQSSGSKTSSETSVAIHKYRTLLSTLLQDRTAQGRWAAIVLIKATIEIGGWETLQKSLPWVRGLLGILTKPDPPSSKKLCIITLTRIFILTREYPTLVREITTPSLPVFIQSSLQIATSKAPSTLLQAILESLNQLLPRHPTIFRSYLQQLQQLLRQVITPTPSNKLSREQIQGPTFELTSDVTVAARQLYTQLPCCAPKGASNVEWQDTVKNIVGNAHRVADKVFRAVVEEWKSAARDLPSVNGHTIEDEVQILEIDAMALPPWSGIHAGSERLIGLLRLVKAYFECPTAGPVNIDISLVADLLTRLLSLTVPPSAGGKGFQSNLRFNNQVNKEEREHLFLILPDVHVAALEILLALARRCEASVLSIDTTMLDQLVWVFTAEKATHQIRTGCYLALAQLLTRSGGTLLKSSIDPLGPIIRSCCDDLLPVDSDSTSAKQSSAQGKANGNSQQVTTNADAFLSASQTLKDPLANFDGLQKAAYALLPVLFANIRPQYFSDSVRARMDRTAILIGHKDAMIASVLNPPRSRKFGKPAASILPLLARTHPGGQDVESLLRPRMPAIRTATRESDLEAEAEEEDEEKEEEEDQEEGDEEAGEAEDHFVGQELDSLLETTVHTDQNTDDTAMQDVSEKEVAHRAIPSLDNAALITDEDVNHGTEVETVQLGKRPQEDGPPSSPTKRVKLDQEQPSMPTPSMPTTFTAPTSTSSEGATIASTAPITSQPSLPPTAPTEPTIEDNSDEDDIVPLVLGQDTDSESD